MLVAVFGKGVFLLNQLGHFVFKLGCSWLIVNRSSFFTFLVLYTPTFFFFFLFFFTLTLFIYFFAGYVTPIINSIWCHVGNCMQSSGWECWGNSNSLGPTIHCWRLYLHCNRLSHSRTSCWVASGTIIEGNYCLASWRFYDGFDCWVWINGVIMGVGKTFVCMCVCCMCVLYIIWKRSDVWEGR